MANSGTIATLTNKGTIGGGHGGAGLSLGDAGTGGAGVWNSWTITTLTNGGTIRGGGGGAGHYAGGGAGGAGVWNLAGARIGALNNATGATIIGGNGGSSSFGGAGGAGVGNSGTIKTLTNDGIIGGGAGGSLGGAGGAGIFNSGSIGPLVNGGTIEGGLAASGGAMSDAIYSAGSHASIGPITNSGQIIGSVEIDNQASVNVYGGTGTTFGSWTKGTITIGNGNLTFAGGNTALGDNISVNGGKGTVFNNDPLMVAAPRSIIGNFNQSATGVLDFGLAGDMVGQYGSLAVSRLAALDGSLGLDLTNRFAFAIGDMFGLMTYGGFSGDFTAVSVDGAACSAAGANVWSCSNVGFNLDLGFSGGGMASGALDLTVAADPPTSGIPEPSTWAMLALGFLGLGGLGLSKRKRADEIGLS